MTTAHAPTDTAHSAPPSPYPDHESHDAPGRGHDQVQGQLPLLQVIRRDGTATLFDETKIHVALTKAFLAVEGDEAASSSRVRAEVDELAAQVVDSLTRGGTTDRAIHIEDIQDQVELALMRAGHHRIARDYVLYRERHQAKREAAKAVETPSAAPEPTLTVVQSDGTRLALDRDRLQHTITAACAELADVDPAKIIDETKRTVYDGISVDELATAQILAARALVEAEPNYSYVTARLLLDKLRREALTFVYGVPTERTQD